MLNHFQDLKPQTVYSNKVKCNFRAGAILQLLSQSLIKLVRTKPATVFDYITTQFSSMMQLCMQLQCQARKEQMHRILNMTFRMKAFGK